MAEVVFEMVDESLPQRVSRFRLFSANVDSVALLILVHSLVE